MVEEQLIRLITSRFVLICGPVSKFSMEMQRLPF